MHRPNSTRIRLAGMLLALVIAPLAHAQATRTWVSGVGDDANPCSRTAPCKTFAGAISKTADSGTINVLDPGGFGSVTITKSITIDGHDVQAGVLVAGTNGININGAGIKVILRNLSLEGVNTGLVGINFVQGAQLTVENCRIFGFNSGAAAGIRVAVAGTAKLVVNNSQLNDNGTGIHLETSAGLLLATMDGVSVENMAGNGIESAGAGMVFALVKRSTVNHNGQDGVRAATGASTFTVVDSSLSLNNGTAVNAAAAGARIRVSGNAIINNAGGLGMAGGAVIESDGTNRIAGFNASAAPNATFGNQ